MNDEPVVTEPVRTGLFRDLQDPRLMYLKAFLFLVAGLLCAVGILVQAPSLTNALLLAVTVWAFCRLYYFLFYVIERYIDPSYRFAGLGSALMYLFRHRRPGESCRRRPLPDD